jgi:hypothetical protein
VDRVGENNDHIKNVFKSQGQGQGQGPTKDQGNKKYKKWFISVKHFLLGSHS